MLPVVMLDKLFHGGERKKTPAARMRRLIGGASLVALGVGLYNGGVYAMQAAQPIKQGITVEAGNQEITNIDLTLQKQCNTEFSARGTSAAKFAIEAFGIKDVAWKQITVQEDAETEFCFENKTVHVAVDKQAHRATVKLDGKDIIADTRVVPGSLQIKTDANMLQAIGDNIVNLYKNTPFVQDVSFIKDAGNGLDAQTSAMANSAITVGLKAAATNCAPKAWDMVAPSFSDGVASQISVGMHALDSSWGPDDISVLIGDAKTPADNARQTVGTTTTVDDAYNKLQQVLGNNNTLSTDQGSLGKCDVPDTVRQQAAQGSK